MKFWILHIIAGGLLLLGSCGCQSLPHWSDLPGASSLFGADRDRDELAFDSDEILDPLGARDGNRLLLSDFSPNQIATTLKIRTSGDGGEQSAKKSFAEGQDFYRAGSRSLDADPDDDTYMKMFVDAANKFRLASADFPDSQLAEDALYFEGESYFFADRYVQSNRAFEKLIANYSGTRHLDMAEFRRYAIAVYWLQLSESTSSISLNDAKRPNSNLAGEARRVLHQIRMDDPTGKLADDASLALGKAFMQADRHYEAADTFEDLRINYPGSKHQFTAHMLELESRLASYQGKDYDDSHLRKADELMKAIVRQFPGESEEQLPYLEKQATLIQNQIAERDYSLGQYFESRGENRAALYYYEKVAQKYQHTELGEVVQQQIEDVATKPAKPVQHLKWLVDAFPNPEAEKPVIMAGTNPFLH